MDYRTVVVGSDGSDSSLAAVDRAASIATAAGALLVVVCAHSPVPARAQAAVSRQTGDTRFGQVLGSEAARDALARATRRAEESGASGVSGVLVEGDPGEALLSVARQRSADLVVVGNRGINSLAGRLLGSVPAAVSREAPCDVLVVRTTSGR
jgi:nucleotide-binding universal stress UspA family protein